MAPARTRNVETANGIASSLDNDLRLMEATMRAEMMAIMPPIIEMVVNGSPRERSVSPHTTQSSIPQNIPDSQQKAPARGAAQTARSDPARWSRPTKLISRSIRRLLVRGQLVGHQIEGVI